MNPPDLSNSSFTLQWWIEGVLVSTETSPESGDGFVYFCEECGTPWAVRYFPNRATIRFHGACARHPPSRGEIPGSLILWWHDELERMPAALVEREYALHLAYYLKEIQDETKASDDTRSNAALGGVSNELFGGLEAGAGEAHSASA